MPDVLDRLKAALADRYLIERELGAGGMATVYLAEDVKHNRKVAVKVLRPELGASLGAERFLREIQIAAQLTHPNILTLIDSGEADGLLYYVMPYVEGESLRDRLDREKQLPLEDALLVTREVADALSLAHSHGVVHRDIKPANILLEAGHAVVADFGIARAVSTAGGEQLTETGMATGTPAYMSPEQGSGEKELDARSDIYSLGCVLYEMLAGEPPYTGPTAQAVFAKRLSEPVPHVSTLRETIPQSVEQAITKALAKAPADRFATATGFIDGLATPGGLDIGRTVEDRRRLPRRRVVVGLVGVVAVGALATVVVREVRPPGDPTRDLGQLAVLPCANRIGDPDQAYIPAGVHDELVTALGRIAAVEVRGRSSVLRYRDTAMSNPEIAHELGVGSLVECSVFRVSNDSVRVMASLRDAPRDRQLWSDTYRRAAAELYLLGSDIARGVADALQANVTPTESARVAAQPTQSQEALTHYHRGRYFATRWTEEDIRRGIEHFEQAIALDSSFARGYTGLAEAIMLQGDVMGAGDIRPVDYVPRVRELVERALDLDPELAEAHSMLGVIKWEYDYDWAAAVRETQRATELDPTSANAWDYYAQALSLSGRDEDAIAAGRRAIELDPVAPWILAAGSVVFLTARKYQEALETANAAIALDPDLTVAIFNAGDAALLLGDHDAAIAFHKLVRAQKKDNPVYLGLIAITYARVGNREEALRILDELLEMRRQRYVSPRAFAAAYLGLDSLDTAIDWLIRAAETRTPSLVWDILSPHADQLRDHPRYSELLRLVRLER
jgi:serine/threonine-protein kinase